MVNKMTKIDKLCYLNYKQILFNKLIFESQLA